MRRLTTFSLLSLIAVLLAACNTPPAADQEVTTTQESVDSIVVEETLNSTTEPDVDETTEINEVIVQTVEPTAEPTDIISTAEPTIVVPTPVSPRPVDDGTVIETPSAEARSYTIQRGDTFSEIAESFGIPSYELAVHNSIFDPNAIEVGQVIEIPAEYAANAPTNSTETEPVVEAVEATETPQPTEAATVEPTLAATKTIEPTQIASEPEETEAAVDREEQSYVVQAGDSLTRLSVSFDVALRELAQANGLQVNSDLLIGQTLIIPASE
ncbi:MAG: LysM peptidoglycan-binding domain-containing protein [Candidatus Promineifilaceae bacterium]